MRSKVWLIALSICGIGLAACDKEDDTVLEPSAVNTSAGDNNNTVDNVGGTATVSSDESPRGEDQEFKLRGDYRITYVEYNGENVTADYSDIIFRFDDTNVTIQGTDVNLKGNYTLRDRMLNMFTEGNAGEHLELQRPYWKITSYELNGFTIGTPFYGGPGYAIVLERL